MFRDRILTDLGIGGGYAIEHFAPGEYVFREGEPGEKIYLIISGRALALRANGDATQVLSEMLPGQFFGELAILNDALRAASVQAADDLEVAALDGASFRTALQRHPRLRSIMASLQSMYMLPGRGLVTLQSSGLASHPSITAVHHLADGRRVLSIRFTEAAAFRAQLIGADEATCSIRFSDPAAGIYRQIHLSDHRMVEIESEGVWQGLGVAFERLLDGVIVSNDEVAAFEASGDLGKGTQPACDAAEIVCRCSGVTAAEIVSSIGKGAGTLEQIARENRATLVCGGCIPAVKEFLGQDEWRATICESSLILAPDIRRFRLRTSSRGPPTLPGQHVVVQARIRGRWVERPYTIASAPSVDGCYELVVRRERKGLLSNWLFDQLDEGGALRLSAPRGTFCIAPGDEGHIVFLAGGIGITPALAMARSIAALPGSWALAIDHSVSTEEQGVYRHELESLSHARPRVTFRLRVTGREGRISPADIAIYLRRYPQATFLICGSPSYVAGVTVLVEGCAVPASRIRSERFIPWG
jgi:nitric-oxide synthase